MRTFRRPRTAVRPRRAGRVLTVASLLLLGLVAVASGASPASGYQVPPRGVPVSASSVALPTVQTDGMVWSVTVVGTTAYAVGDFTTARNPGTAVGDPSQVPRAGILAFDVTSGRLLPFSHTIAGTPFASTTNPGPYCDALAPGPGGTPEWVCKAAYRVKASPDGSRLYVVGDFTSVDGSPRGRIAAFDLPSGGLDAGFAPTLDNRVRALAVTTSTVYVGGDFSTVNATTGRTRLAAFSASGTLLAWAPTADVTVWALVVSGDGLRVVVGGNFDYLDGTAQHGLGAVDPVTGANEPWSSRPLLHVGGYFSYVTDLTVDATTVYASSDGEGPKFFDGRLAANPDTGDLYWVDRCQGATQAITLYRGVLYSASHSHDCHQMNAWYDTPVPRTYQRMIAETSYAAQTSSSDGTPIPLILHDFPYINGGPSTSYWQSGPWAAGSGAGFVVLGGEFTNVDGVAQQGLTRFQVRPGAPTAPAPLYPFDPPTGQSLAPGKVVVSWTATWDRDFPTLRYTVYRDGSTPIATLSAASAFWSLPTLHVIDSALVVGSVHTYRVSATDPTGGGVADPSSLPIRVAATAPTQAYAAAVTADAPTSYWRLGESSGSVAQDARGADPGTYGSAMTYGTPGAIPGDPDTAVTFPGVQTATMVATVAQAAPTTFTEEAWFATTSTTAGKLIGFGNGTAAGTSTLYDREIYMDNAGRLNFGVLSAPAASGAYSVVQTRLPYNDGNWHLVDASLDAQGMRLSVDGEPVGSNPSLTVPGTTYTGYWHVGGDTNSGWPYLGPTEAVAAFAGSLDEVAVYPAALTPAQVTNHFVAASAAADRAPYAVPSVACAGTACSVDSVVSVDLDGTIVSAQWSFGDGTTAATPAALHRYAAPGSYPLRLTVTDDRGRATTAGFTLQVLPDLPHPVARAGCSHLLCSLSGRATRGGAGALSYQWDFGDGSAGTGVTTSHRYATPGRYPVTLTVTDSQGRSATARVTAAATA